jgi:hypothetical protein
MSLIRCRVIPGLLLAVAVLLGGTALTARAAAPAATAATGSIFGPCTSLQYGDYRWFGKLLYECVHVPGLGGYYWVRVSFPGCGATPADRAARLPAC